MATSYAIYKKEITDYLKELFTKKASILDVGAGEGTYLPFLQDYFTNIEAVEVFKPNIDNFNLEERYKKVYNIDIRYFEYDYYDIIIFGDIIEHLDVKDAQKVLKYAYNRCKFMIVAVPYLSPQGIEEDNVYEIHNQSDLTDEIMKQRYPYLKCIFKNYQYGYYIKEEEMKNYIVKAIINFNDTTEKTEAGTDTPRTANVSVWNCTKERYEFLKEHNAVILMGIDKIEETKTIKEEKTIEERIEDIRNMDVGEPIPKEKFEKIKKEYELKSKKKKTSKK